MKIMYMLIILCILILLQGCIKYNKNWDLLYYDKTVDLIQINDSTILKLK